MFDFEIAFYLYKMAKVQKIFLNNIYKAKAYYSAALAVDAYDCYVTEMYKNDALQEIPFIGKKMEKSIIEILETNELQELMEYEKMFDIKDYSLILSNGLSENLLKKLVDLSIKSVDDLLDNRNVSKLEGGLTKSEYDKVQFFLKEYKKNQGKYLLAYGKCLGEGLIKELRKVEGISNAILCGEVSQYCEKVSKVEILFNYQGEWKDLEFNVRKISGIINLKSNAFINISGNTKFGIPFVLKYCEDILQKDREDGLSCYIKGDLHTHTLWTDGIHSIEEMGKAAIDRNYEFLGITDHSSSMRIAHGLSESQALSQVQKIREYNKQHELKILAGIEVDILPDGSLDYCDEVLEQFDFVIAAVHSQLEQETNTLYNRLEKALSNPYVNIFAHPTSRLLGRPGIMFCERKPYNVGLQNIINLCKKYDVALEVNCFPERLDMGKEGIILAVEHGVKIALGTDAHSRAHLCNIEYGIGIVEQIEEVDKNMILNTYTYSELMEYFKIKRPKTVSASKKERFELKNNFNYYFKNNNNIIEGKKSIVGIDLTGNEEKESGWAYLKSNYAECKRIKSDNEIIESIKQYNPDIVSIDSPLAYPKGRCCSRKDCECSKYGIMRKSERLLRHFGITVYPCLIDSMVNLTTRGMALAKELRAMGYTVIESYPGVAQDILQIPRKGKTVEQFTHLKQGLASFGIKGDLLDKPYISHDEVDAITSALVGYFYINEQYVGLGNEDEDYLIVPRIQEELINKRIVIGLSGETGAGKTTVADYLQFKYGMKKFRYSQIIEQMYGICDKEGLQKIGARIAKEPLEQQELTRYMIRNMEEDKSYVIDGLRHMEDYEELRKYFGDNFVFIYLECKYMNRYKRYNKLHFNNISPEKFEYINNHESEKDIILLKLKSGYRIDNNKGFKDLRIQIDEIIKKES